MDITKKYNQKELTLSVEGRIDTITSKDLENAIDEEFGNFDSLTMDFTHVNYISSAGLRVLIVAHKKLKNEDIPFSIKNVNDTIGEIFGISGLDKILKIV